MAKSKKVISIVLTFVLIFSTFAVSASAWTGTGSQEVKIELTADKEIVNPGDKVTVSVKFHKNESGTWQNKFGTFVFSWVYNNSLATLSDLTWGEVLGNFAQLANISTITAASSLQKVKAASTAEDQAKWDANGFNAMSKIQSRKDSNSQYGSQGYWESTDGMTIATFTLTVSDSAKPGEKIYLDMSSGILESKKCNIAPLDETGKPVVKADAAFFDASDASLELTVASPAPAGPVVTKAKSQVKMTATSANTVADEFSFRVISKISDSDWDTYFKNTGVADATTDYITAVGMVAYKGAAAFDADTAKRVVAGESVADYTAATTDYISKVNDTADAEFGAIIKANHSTLNNDVTYMGFVQYVDASGNAQTIFYETAGTAALSTNYNNIVNAYLEAYPFAA